MWTFQLPNATAALGELGAENCTTWRATTLSSLLWALRVVTRSKRQQLNITTREREREPQSALYYVRVCVCLQWGVERLFVCWLLHKRVHSRLKTNGDIPHSWLLYQTRSAHYNNKGWHIFYRRLHAALDTLYRHKKWVPLDARHGKNSAPKIWWKNNFVGAVRSMYKAV
jgi:hypothetical protein